MHALAKPYSKMLTDHMKMSNHSGMKNNTLNRTFVLPAALLGAIMVFSACTQAAEAAKLPTPSAKEKVTFSDDIKPLFERSCTKCHGEEKQKAKLRLDSREAVLKGAHGEEVIASGKSAESKLVLAISKATEDEDEWMPPLGKADDLTPEEIGLVRAWIDQGAK